LYPFVDLFFEFVLIDEAVDLDGAEEMADAFASRDVRRICEFLAVTPSATLVLTQLCEEPMILSNGGLDET